MFLVSILAIFYGTSPILLASTLSALIWDYFFIPPQFTLHIDKAEDMMMFIMFFIIALLNGILTSRVRRQEKKIRIREERTNALYQLTKELSSSKGVDDITLIATKYISKYFGLDCIIILKNELNALESQIGNTTKIKLSSNEMSVIEWVYKSKAKAGKNTETLPSGKYTYYPLNGKNGCIGVITVEHNKVFTQGEEQFWDAIISQISGKIESEFLRNAAKKAYILSESEKLYKTLFNSISHELRIPVTAIIGASDNLLNHDLSTETVKIIYSEINIAAIRLNRLIENLLNMSRLESGRITPKLDWSDLHDIINKVLDNLSNELSRFELQVVISNDMPLVKIDFGLIEQVIQNLLLNATQNSPEKSSIRIKIFHDNGFLVIQLMDRGKGFPESELPYVFDKFYRCKDAKTGGTGLGLSIVKGFVEAHEGTVSANNRRNGGAIFTIKIPAEISVMNLTDKN